MRYYDPYAGPLLGSWSWVQTPYLGDSELARYQNALNNFRAYHGYEPHPAVNMVAILRDYSVPWRKTTIPHVKRRRDAAIDRG